MTTSKHDVGPRGIRGRKTLTGGIEYPVVNVLSNGLIWWFVSAKRLDQAPVILGSVLYSAQHIPFRGWRMRRPKAGKTATLFIDEAIRLFNRGDAKAFDLIYRSYREFVQRICLCMLRDPVEAEDATQDVFVCLFHKINTFRGESAFSSWLYRLTTNSVLMRFRKNRQRWVPLEETEECNGGSYNEISLPDLNLSGVLDRIDLESAIDVLPNGYKAAFVLHDIQGYRHKEIAEMFGRSIETSRSQLHKARLRLRKLLTGIPKKEVPQDLNQSVLPEIANSSAKGIR